jgi:hypothetical protein
MWLILFLCLFIPAGPAHAEAAFALIRPIKGSELIPPHVLRQLQRTSLQVAAKQKGLQLLLSGEDPPTGSTIDVLSIESEITKGENGSFNIVTRLVDLKAKKIVNTNKRENIPEEYLMRLYQGAIESLFIPVDEKPGEDKIRDPKELLKPPTPTVKDSVLPTTTQTRKQNESEIDFKKRLKDLQGEVDAKMAMAKAANLAAKANENKVAVKTNASNMGGIEKTGGVSTTEEKFPPPAPNGRMSKRYSIDFGYEKRTLSSTDLVITQASAELLTLKGKMHSPFLFQSGWLAYTLEGAVGKPVSTPAEIPTPYELGAGLTLLGPSSFLSFGVVRDSAFFFNLPVPGGGLQTSQIDTNWLKASGDVTFNFKYPFGFFAAVGTPMGVKSNYGVLKEAGSWSGTFFQAAFRFTALVKNLDSSIMYERSTLSTEGVRPFTLNETRLSLLLRYSL